MNKTGLAALTVGTFAIGTDLYLVSGILPALAGGLGVSSAVAGQLATIFALTYALGAPVLTTLTAGYPRKKLLILSLVLFAVGNLLTAAAPDFILAALARVTTALAACLFIPNAAALVAVLEKPERRGTSLGLLMAGLNLATVAGVPLGIAVNVFWGWRAAFVFVSGISALGALWVLWAVPEPGPGPKTTLAKRFGLLGDRSLLPILGTTLVTITGAFTVYTYLSVEFHQVLGVGDGFYATLTALFGILGLIGAWAGGKVADTWGPQLALAGTLGALVLIFGGMGFAGSMVWPMAALVLAWGFVGAAFTPVQQLRVIRAVPQGAPGGLALHSSAVYLGQALAGITGAWAIAGPGPQALGWAAVPFFLTGLGVFLLTRKKTHIAGGLRSPVL